MSAPGSPHSSAVHGATAWLEEARRLDLSVYAAVAGTATPVLDSAMSKLSSAADYSRLSLAAAALMSLGGGAQGRRGAVNGLTALAVTATVVNVVIKPLARRRRPDRAAHHVPLDRHVPIPGSRSFPSGHSAAAFAFASGAGRHCPAASLPLHGLAGLVAYSRVHTGVHYPADVLAGSLLGAVIAQISSSVVETRILAEQRPAASTS